MISSLTSVHSERKAESSGARSAAAVAPRDASSPVTNTPVNNTLKVPTGS
jgi:hypothetical protein